MTNQEPAFPVSPCDVGPFRIGDWLVEPGLNRVTRGEHAQQVEPRVMHVLCCLAWTPGRVVSRGALLDAVWTKAVVNEEALTHAISQLRRVFSDEAKRPRFIQTIHKTGYLLVQPARWLEPDEVARLQPGTAEARPQGLPGQVEAATPAADMPETAETQAPPPAQPQQPAIRVIAPPGRRLSRRWLGVALAGLALVILLVSIVATRPRSRQGVLHKPVVLDEIPFTTYPGREAYPAISPDGTRIAFAWKETEDGNYDLFVKQHNAETPLRLTATDGNECLPAWSPDGTEIAYGLISATDISINVVPAIGGAPRRVTMASRTLAGLDWSPDGTLLAYGTEDGAAGPLKIFLCSLATGEARALTDPLSKARGDFRPVFSPDGKRLAFVRGDLTNLHDIYLVPVAGGQPERLTDSFHYITGLDWTSDSRYLVVSAAPSQTADSRLWRLSVGDGSRTWLPIGAPHPTRLSVAQRGSGLVLEVASVSSDIVRLRVGVPCGAPEPIAPSTQQDFSAQYSPGGHLMTFISTRSGSPQVWVCEADGASPRQVTQFDDARIWSPCWSYDERQVAFSAARENVAGIYVADLESRRVRCVSESDQHQVALGWSRDGRWLYCKIDRDGHWWVRRVALDAGEVTDIMEKDVFRLAESVDGTRLVFSRADISSIWSVAPDGSDEVCLADSPGMVIARGWREVEQGLYFFSMAVESEAPRTISLCFKDRVTGETRALAAVADFASSNLDVSPDGAYVIADRLEDLGSDLVLVGGFR
jgi:Tol biopolymer transport system component/DNA-binding winged helix-turn-helix (wHTH) protein